MVDRLGKLRSKAGVDDLERGVLSTTYGTLIEAGDNGGDGLGVFSENPEKFMDKLILSQTNLTSALSDIKDVTAQIRVCTKEAVVAASSDKERKISTRVSNLVDDGKERIMQIKNELTELKEMQSIHDDEMSPAETQLCTTVIVSSSATFRKHITNYMQVQEDYRQAVKSKVERQLRIAYPDAPEDEIQELANEDPASVREAIKQQVQRGGHADLHSTLHDLHERYDDLKKLEESVLELRDMFIYLSALVDEQGELLDNIEKNVNSTKEYTGEAVEQIQIAKEHKESYESKRNWMQWMLCAIGVVIALLVLLALGPLFQCLAPILSCCVPSSSSKQSCTSSTTSAANT